MSTQVVDFLTPDDWLSLLEGYRRGLKDRGASPAEMALRTRSQKDVRELRQAVLFGYAYREAHSLYDLKVATVAQEYSETDALLTWTEAGIGQGRRVQLKELPPSHLNPTAQLEKLLQGVAKKHYAGRDLFLAFFLNRFEYFGTFSVPLMKVSEIWFYGFSKPDFSEMMLVGGSPGVPTTSFRLPFRPAS